ncbi:MAG: hypothetical protein ABGY96_29035 [bacterium]
MICLGEETSRLRLFNWVTVLLITSWVLVVAVVVETTEVNSMEGEVSAQVFIENLLN